MLFESKPGINAPFSTIANGRQKAFSPFSTSDKQFLAPKKIIVLFS
jgi:hypothetical protein